MMPRQVKFLFPSLFNLLQLIKANLDNFGKVCGTVTPKTPARYIDFPFYFILLCQTSKQGTA